jgi:hypothetical protein
VSELPCDTENYDLEPLPEDVQEVAMTLMEALHESIKLADAKQDPGFVVTPPDKITVRSIVSQPPLPEIFNLIIRNYNKRREILAKGSSMTQEDWRKLKELNWYMRTSLRPAAVMATSYSDNH